MTTTTWMRTAALVVGIAVLVTSPAAAEGFGEVGGIKFGALTIFPSLSTGIRYDSNIYFSPDKTADQRRLNTPGKESDFILNVSPDVQFDVTTGGFNAQLGYTFYGDIFAGYDDPAKMHQRLNAANHTFRGEVGYTAPIGFLVDVKDQFLLQEEFTNSNVYVDYLPGRQKHNDGTFTIGYNRPPDGTVYVTAAYRNLYDDFDKRSFEKYDRVDHFLDLILHLKFFPRTAVVLEATGGALRHPHDADFNALVYYGMAGVQGQITNHIELRLKGGFAVWDFVKFDDYRQFIATGEVAFIWPPATRVAVGYDRYVEPGSDTNFRATDEIHLTYEQVFNDRFGLDSGISYMFNFYSRPKKVDEQYLNAHVDLTTRLLYWFYLGVGYDLQYKMVEPGRSTEADITRHTAMVKVQAKF